MAKGRALDSFVVSQISHAQLTWVAWVQSHLIDDGLRNLSLMQSFRSPGCDFSEYCCKGWVT